MLSGASPQSEPADSPRCTTSNSRTAIWRLRQTVKLSLLTSTITSSGTTGSLLAPEKRLPYPLAGPALPMQVEGVEESGDDGDGRHEAAHHRRHHGPPEPGLLCIQPPPLHLLGVHPHRHLQELVDLLGFQWVLRPAGLG